MRLRLLHLPLVIAGLGLGTVSNAAIMISDGNNPQPPEYNVLLNTDATGTTILGSFNDFPELNAVFTSSQTLTAPANGQARVEALGTDLTTLTISLSGGYTFGDIIFALNPLGGPGPNPTYSITATGTQSTSTRSGTVTTGNQFFTIVGTGERLTSISIASSGLDDVRQVRFSEITAPGGGSGGGGEVPEPSTVMLLGGGVAVLALARKRRWGMQ